MTDFSNSVILPREDFAELETAAYVNNHVPDAKERIGQTLQAGGVFGLMAAAVVAGTWGWATGVDWLDKRRTKRADAQHEKIMNSTPKIDN